MEFCVNFPHGFRRGLPSLLNDVQKIHREIHTKIHDKIPAKSTHVVKNGVPKGPKTEKIQDRPPGLKFSSKIEHFKHATSQTQIFGGGEF